MGALFLMCSLPGAVLLYYGDEYGAEDDTSFMKQKTALKQASSETSLAISHDTRDINRAPISVQAEQTDEAIKIQSVVGSILQCRRKFSELATTYPERIESSLFSDQFFIARYILPEKTLITFLNLADTSITVPRTALTLPSNFSRELTVGQVEFTSDTITIGSFSGAWLAYGLDS